MVLTDVDKNIVRGKKLLILSGNSQHIKVAEAAKELGVYTIVADYLDPESSPAKKVADEIWMDSFSDVDTLVSRCKKAGIDGVLTCYRESTLIPYYRICQELDLPCYADIKQFDIMMNKKKFKKLCMENNVSVIDEFTLDDVAGGNIEFPVFVKPADNGASKGQSICYNMDELLKAIKFAESESVAKEIIIEKYYANKNSFQVTYFFVNGVPYVIRTADGYKGKIEDNLDRVALCSISPSEYTREFLDTTNDNLVKMFERIGVKDGPVMVQGFYDNGTFRFYDPGRRFPGTDFELVYKEEFGIDLMRMMVVFAISGKMPGIALNNDNVFLHGKKAVVLFPTLQMGTIGAVQGFEQLKKDSRIRNIRQKYNSGETIDKPNTTLQRIFEIDFISERMEEIVNTIEYIQRTINVKDINGRNMLYKPFDVSRLSEKSLGGKK